MDLLLDAMCGRLAVYLRMCGHDAAYVLDRGVEADDRVLVLADEEGRTLVTHDVRLAGRAGDAVLLDSTDIREELRELRTAGVDLTLTEVPARCGRCNAALELVPANEQMPEYVPDGMADVWRCSACGQHFWKGSHWDDVGATLAEL